MQLYNYTDEVNEIVTTAQNEAKIENELLKIESCWRHINMMKTVIKTAHKAFSLLESLCNGFHNA